MMQLTFSQDRAQIAREFIDRAWQEQSGLEPNALRENCRALWAQSANQPIQARRAQIMVYLMDHGQIEVQPYECFADQLRHEGILADLTWEYYHTVRAELKEALLPTVPAAECRAFTGDLDFGHTCPDWRALLTLGYPGLIARLRDSREKAISPEQMLFYDSCIAVYEALLRLMRRLANEAEEKSAAAPRLLEVARNLRALATRPPQTLHEALQLSTLTYFMQQEMEMANVRSLGRFDLLYQPFYESDLAAGRLTRATAKELLQYYFYRWNARDIVANIPITLCGTDGQGREVASDFTRLLLESYGELQIISPKFHIRCTPGMPKDVLAQVLTLIRNGTNSFVFCNDEKVEAAMRGLGESAEDARDYVMVGCYESTAMGKEIACTCNGRISFPKAVEYALTGGIDLLTGQQIGPENPAPPATFEAFQEAVRAQLRFFADACMRRISLIETQYPRVFSAPFFSATLADCVIKGRDAFDRGAKYNNSSINAFGIATAADALAAIRQLVYDEKSLTLAELAEILKSNWAGHEKLRLRCRQHLPKYGVNDASVDALAADLMDTAARRINGAPNGRGGVFRLGAFSIDWRFDFGEHTGASADGRLAGAPISKNLCAELGMDRAGVTALLQSAARFDGAGIPNGTVLDIVLHESAVAGSEGLDAMLGLLKGYLRQGGLCLQCNVLSADTLREAQVSPEKYPTLQVRLCGWNVLFVNLSRKEQDELILQAQGA